MKRVSFHELAERELNDAALYYEQESTGLGNKFLDEIERYVEAIIKNPLPEKRFAGKCAVASYAHFHTAFCE